MKEEAHTCVNGQTRRDGRGDSRAVLAQQCAQTRAAAGGVQSCQGVRCIRQATQTRRPTTRHAYVRSTAQSEKHAHKHRAKEEGA